MRRVTDECGIRHVLISYALTASKRLSSMSIAAQRILQQPQQQQQHSAARSNDSSRVSSSSSVSPPLMASFARADPIPPHTEATTTVASLSSEVELSHRPAGGSSSSSSFFGSTGDSAFSSSSSSSFMMMSGSALREQVTAFLRKEAKRQYQVYRPNAAGPLPVDYCVLLEHCRVVGEVGAGDRALYGDLVVELLLTFESLWAKPVNASVAIGAVSSDHAGSALRSWGLHSEQPRRDVVVAALRALAPSDALLLVKHWYMVDDNASTATAIPNRVHGNDDDGGASLVESVCAYYEGRQFREEEGMKTATRLSLLNEPEVVGAVAAAVIGTKHPQKQRFALGLLEGYYRWWMRRGKGPSSSSSPDRTSLHLPVVLAHQRMTSLAAEAAARQGDSELVVRCIFSFARVHGGLQSKPAEGHATPISEPAATLWGTWGALARRWISYRTPSSSASTSCVPPSLDECIAQLLRCSIRAAGQSQDGASRAMALFHSLRRDAPFSAVVEMGTEALQLWRRAPRRAGGSGVGREKGGCRAAQDRAVIDVLGRVMEKYDAAKATPYETASLAKAVAIAVALHCNLVVLPDWLGLPEAQLPVARSPVRALELFRSLPVGTAPRQEALPFALAAACAMRNAELATRMIVVSQAEEEGVVSAEVVQRAVSAASSSQDSAVLLGLLTMAVLQSNDSLEKETTKLLVAPLAALSSSQLIGVCRVLTASPPLAHPSLLCSLWKGVLQYTEEGHGGGTQQHPLHRSAPLLLAMCASLQCQSLTKAEPLPNAPCDIATTLQELAARLLNLSSSAAVAAASVDGTSHHMRSLPVRSVSELVYSDPSTMVLVDPSVWSKKEEGTSSHSNHYHHPLSIPLPPSALSASSSSPRRVQLIVPLWASHFAAQGRLHDFTKWVDAMVRGEQSSNGGGAIDVVFVMVTAALDDDAVVATCATRLFQTKPGFVWLEGNAALRPLFPAGGPNSVQVISSARRTMEQSFSAVQQMLRPPQHSVGAVSSLARTSSSSSSSSTTATNVAQPQSSSSHVSSRTVVAASSKSKSAAAGAGFLSKVLAKTKQ